MGKWGVVLGPEVVEQIHARIVQIARDHRVAAGRRMRVDTTVVETNIHYPTDSNLLGDGVRVLTRTMKQPAGWSVKPSPLPRRSTTASKRAEGSRQAVLEGLRRELENVLPRVQQVIRQTKARILAGDTHAEGKIVSLFEPTIEVIRKSLPRRRPAKAGQGRQVSGRATRTS